MRFELTRSGGVAGLARTIAIEDTNVLPAERAAELERLVTAARFWELPADATPGHPLPDAFSHELVVSDGTQTHAVAFETRSASPELSALVAAVRSAAETS